MNKDYCDISGAKLTPIKSNSKILPPEAIEEIKRKAEKATPGPWEQECWYGADDGGWVAVGPHHYSHDDYSDDDPDSETNKKAESDAEHIAQMNPAFTLDLLASHEKLRTLLKEAHQVILDRLRVQATTIFIEEPEHVEHFFKPLKDFLTRLDQEMK